MRLLIALAFLAASPLLRAQDAFVPTRVKGGPGSITAVSGWQIQSSSKAQQGGAEVSNPGYPTEEWYAVSGRATVMAGLLENGRYPNVFYGDNLRAVEESEASGSMFVIPWWYRTEFTVDQAGPEVHTALRINGMIPGADVWLNGHLLADRASIAGAYPVHEIDITPWVHAGSNALALRVYAGGPRTSLSIGWVDWNPEPPDHNMGPWRGVDIVRTGPVAIGLPRVTSNLSLPDLALAALTVQVEVRNLAASAHDATVSGVVAGVSLRRTVHLAPGETQSVLFSPQSDPALNLHHPRIWWPVGMGEHPLYDLQINAAVDGALSDRASATFGIRSVTSHLTPEGYRRFVINGTPVLIRGAGWASDLFLRDNPGRMQTEIDYVLNLGLNTIRNEGMLEDTRFYDLADRAGLMILAGWECCDKWEAAAMTGGEPWDASDEKVAAASMASEARLLRNHPSVIGFLIGGDYAPPPRIATMYVDTLHAEGWSMPIIASAADRTTAETGPSGMKMPGPYTWVPPAYWYTDKPGSAFVGGAFGFNSEASAGPSIPLLEDLSGMLSPQEQEALWTLPRARQYHAGAAWSEFADLSLFSRPLVARYGAPNSLQDFVAKAQLDNYDNVRAQFEAFNAHMDAARPSTGVIYWMLNSAWPSLHWHLYDYALNPAGAYFGAKKANEAVHIQYSYDTHAVMLVNHTLTRQQGLRAAVRIRNLDGSVRFERRMQRLELPGNTAQEVLRLPDLAGLSGAYFIELELAAAGGQPISRNVYWLSTQPDELDWENSNWYITPVTRYADLTALLSLPTAASEVRATLQREAGRDIATVTLTLPASARGVALFQHVSIRQGADSKPVLPVLWSDNDVTLWPGESVTLTAHFATPQDQAPIVEVSGWHLPAQSVPFVSGDPAGAPLKRDH